LVTSPSTAALRLKAGGSIWLKRGSRGNGIGQRVPDVSRIKVGL